MVTPCCYSPNIILAADLSCTFHRASLLTFPFPLTIYLPLFVRGCRFDFKMEIEISLIILHFPLAFRIVMYRSALVSTTFHGVNIFSISPFQG